MHRHQASGLKQNNKAHKSKFTTKGALKKQAKGKVEDEHQSLKKATTKFEGRQDRKNRQKHLNQNKKEAAIAAKRFGTREGAPKIVGIVHIGTVEDDNKVRTTLLQHCGFAGDIEEAGPATVCVGKHRFTFVNAIREYDAVLDVAKVADILLMVLPVETGIDALGERLISLIKAQGVPTIIGLLVGLESVVQKKRNDVKKKLVKDLHYHFPAEPRVLLLDKAEDSANIFRFLESASAGILHWRQNRAYMLADKVEADSLEGELGTVKISGYLRGGNLSANQLIHIPDFGDFQIVKVDGVADPYPSGRPSPQTMDIANRTLDEPDPEDQETLITENEPDLLNNEQTWPTTEELIEADARRSKKKKLVPKGTSSYQAAWLIESDEEFSGDEDDDDVVVGKESDDEMQDDGKADHDEESDKKGTATEDDDEGSDFGDDKSMLSDDEDGGKRKEDEKWEFEFPDEVAAPDDKPARVRFQRYRGLKSFRTSPWDPKENLPLEYGRIFQFQSFNRSMKRVLENSKTNPVEAGSYVTIHIAAVPLSLVKSYDPSKPLVIGGLFKYENKISVLHFHIVKHASYSEPVKSKDKLIFHVGLRRFETRPIFSESTPNCDKQKMVKFLMPGLHPIVASIYGPITFPPAPLLVFSPDGDLVATGSLIEVNPDRIITKRIILTGVPLRVRKKAAVVREMFYFPEDIEWFKPVDLWTKNGRNGNIREPLGTHGRMKCIFDQPLSQADTICMSLYKRCFPKWPETSYSKQYSSSKKQDADDNTTNNNSNNKEMQE